METGPPCDPPPPLSCATLLLCTALAAGRDVARERAGANALQGLYDALRACA